MLKNILLQFICKKIIELNVGKLLAFIGVFSILPFLLISIYINPSADDFCYHNATQVQGFCNAQLDWYLNWSGRYFSSAVLSVQPIVSNPFYIYKAIPIVLILFLFYSLYKINCLIFWPIEKVESVVSTFLIFILYLIQMPTVSEGFYWLAGSVNYQLSNVIFIWLVYYILKLLKNNQVVYLIPALILTVVVVGTNETTMLIVDLFLGSFFVFKYYQTKQVNYYLLLLLVTAILCSGIVYFSPGNVIRASTYPNKHKIIYSLIKTINGISSYMAIWLPFMVISSLLYFDFLREKGAVVRTKFLKVNPVIVLFFLGCILFIGFFTSYWSIGEGPQLRTLNTVYFFFLLGFLYFLFVLQLKLSYKNKSLFSFSREVKALMFVLFFLQLGKNNNIKEAYKDLFSGEAYLFNEGLARRYEMIHQDFEGKCIVPKLKHKPKTIFSHDITNNPKDWKNEAYRVYFRKKSISTY